MDILIPDFSLLIMIALGIALLNIGLLVTALVMLLRNNTLDSNTKLMWVLIILFVPTVGAILYFVFYNNKGNRRTHSIE